MGFSRQEYWSGLPFPSPGDLPDPGIEPGSPALQADTLTSEEYISNFNACVDHIMNFFNAYSISGMYALAESEKFQVMQFCLS